MIVLELKPTNHALGNRDELLRIMREQGYWFFRDVLDRDALATIRGRYMAELYDRDLIEAGNDEPVWNRRTPLTIDDGVTSSRFPRLRDGRVWETFVAQPAISHFFKQLAGEEPEWLTASDYYRIVPPGQDAGEDPYALRHQDGAGLPGLDFATCWIPLADVDTATGGLAIVPGSHKHGVVPKRMFDKDVAPDDGWARADYRLGDVLMFTGAMLHSGMRNQSEDRFRLSLDIRLYMTGSPRPVSGSLTSITPDDVVIRGKDGADVSLKVNDDTFILVMTGDNEIPKPFTRHDAPSVLHPGRQVMAVGRDGAALIVRPANSGGY
jgi:ectoine hydroxylase-related dioxygenase (phytanoyl-CoA dioxygenase family)